MLFHGVQKTHHRWSTPSLWLKGRETCSFPWCSLSSDSGFSLPLTIWLVQIAVQTWAQVSALVSGLACTPPGTGELSGLAICLWVAQAESAEKMCWWERNSSSLCLNKAAALANHWPRISRRGNNCKALHFYWTCPSPCHLPLTRTTPKGVSTGWGALQFCRLAF